MPHRAVLPALGFDPNDLRVLEESERPRLRGLVVLVVCFLLISMLFHPGALLDHALFDSIRDVKTALK